MRRRRVASPRFLCTLVLYDPRTLCNNGLDPRLFIESACTTRGKGNRGACASASAEMFCELFYLLNSIGTHERDVIIRRLQMRDSQ